MIIIIKGNSVVAPFPIGNIRIEAVGQIAKVTNLPGWGGSLLFFFEVF